MKRLAICALAVFVVTAAAACTDNPVGPTGPDPVQAVPSFELTGDDLATCKALLGGTTYDKLCESPTLQAALCSLVTMSRKEPLTVKYTIGFVTVVSTIRTERGLGADDVIVTITTETYFGVKLIASSKSSVTLSGAAIKEACTVQKEAAL